MLSEPEHTAGPTTASPPSPSSLPASCTRDFLPHHASATAQRSSARAGSGLVDARRSFISCAVPRLEAAGGSQPNATKKSEVAGAGHQTTSGTVHSALCIRPVAPLFGRGTDIIILVLGSRALATLGSRSLVMVTDYDKPRLRRKAGQSPSEDYKELLSFINTHTHSHAQKGGHASALLTL